MTPADRTWGGGGLERRFRSPHVELYLSPLPGDTMYQYSIADATPFAARAALELARGAASFARRVCQSPWWSVARAGGGGGLRHRG